MQIGDHAVAPACRPDRGGTMAIAARLERCPSDRGSSTGADAMRGVERTRRDDRESCDRQVAKVLATSDRRPRVGPRRPTRPDARARGTPRRRRAGRLLPVCVPHVTLPDGVVARVPYGEPVAMAGDGRHRYPVPVSERPCLRGLCLWAPDGDRLAAPQGGGGRVELRVPDRLRTDAGWRAGGRRRAPRVVSHGLQAQDGPGEDPAGGQPIEERGPQLGTPRPSDETSSSAAW